MMFDRLSDQFVSGPEGVAGRHDLGRVLLSIDAPVPPRRAVWTDVADQASGGIGSRQYRGRAWAGAHRQLRSASANLAGLSEGTGNTSDTSRTRRYFTLARSAAGSRPMRELGQNASCVDTVAAGQVREMMPLAIRYSPFAKARSAR